MSEQVEYRPPTPIVVWLIVAAIALAHGAFVLASPATQSAVDEAFALIPARYHAESVYRFSEWYEAILPIFGHAFLHVAWWHAGINGFFFFLTARLPATILGPWRFLGLFLISTAASAAAFLALNWNDRAMAVGASGALCGVFSAYFLSARPSWRESLADPRVRGPYAMMFIINVVVMGLAAEFFRTPIAWEAHLGGFVGGAVGWIALAPRRGQGN